MPPYCSKNNSLGVLGNMKVCGANATSLDSPRVSRLLQVLLCCLQDSWELRAVQQYWCCAWHSWYDVLFWGGTVKNCQGINCETQLGDILLIVWCCCLRQVLVLEQWTIKEWDGQCFLKKRAMGMTVSPQLSDWTPCAGNTGCLQRSYRPVE